MESDKEAEAARLYAGMMSWHPEQDAAACLKDRTNIGYWREGTAPALLSPPDSISLMSLNFLVSPGI
jgi:hypothetical protein